MGVGQEQLQPLLDTSCTCPPSTAPALSAPGLGRSGTWVNTTKHVCGLVTFIQWQTLPPPSLPAAPMLIKPKTSLPDLLEVSSTVDVCGREEQLQKPINFLAGFKIERQPKPTRERKGFILQGPLIDEEIFKSLLLIDYFFEKYQDFNSSP